MTDKMAGMQTPAWNVVNLALPFPARPTLEPTARTGVARPTFPASRRDGATKVEKALTGCHYATI